MKLLEAGLREAHGMQSEGSGEFQKPRRARKCMKMYKGMGIKLLRSGSNISAPIMSAKLE